MNAPTITDALAVVAPRGSRLTGTFGSRAQVEGTPWATSPTHKGLDVAPAIAGTTGVPLRAPEAGKVWYAARDDHGALDLFIGSKRDGWRIVHNARHLVAAGDNVAAGQLVAIMGATGNVNGIHAHVERWIDGAPVDPLPYLLRLATPKASAPAERPAPPIRKDDDMSLPSHLGGRVWLLPGGMPVALQPQRHDAFRGYVSSYGTYRRPDGTIATDEPHPAWEWVVPSIVDEQHRAAAAIRAADVQALRVEVDDALADAGIPTRTV